MLSSDIGFLVSTWLNASVSTLLTIVPVLFGNASVAD
jgi:hypothetical protein